MMSGPPWSGHLAVRWPAGSDPGDQEAPLVGRELELLHRVLIHRLDREAEEID